MKKLLIIFILGLVLLNGCGANPEIGKIEPMIEQKQETPVKTYNIGESINLDYLTYKVHKAESFTKMGTSMMKKETNGKFIKLYLSILNKAKETKQIFSPRFTLIDSQDRQFDQAVEATLYIKDFILFGEQLQPGLPLEGAIVFELPKDANNLKLKVVGDWLSISEVIINLNNIQDIGQDTTMQDELDTQMEDIMEQSQQQMEAMMDNFNL